MIDSIRGTQLPGDQGRAATADYRLFTTDCTKLLPGKDSDNPWAVQNSL